MGDDGSFPLVEMRLSCAFSYIYHVIVHVGVFFISRLSKKVTPSLCSVAVIWLLPLFSTVSNKKAPSTS